MMTEFVSYTGMTGMYQLRCDCKRLCRMHVLCACISVQFEKYVKDMMLGLQTQVGLQPDLACVPEVTQAEYWVAGSRDSEDLSQDPCIQMAQDKLSSMQPKGEGQ